jgi:hypothetical protein
MKLSSISLSPTSKVIDAYNPQFSHIEYGEKFKLISSAHTIRM